MTNEEDYLLETGLVFLVGGGSACPPLRFPTLLDLLTLE
jgi:hypothetical protein